MHIRVASPLIDRRLFPAEKRQYFLHLFRLCAGADKGYRRAVQLFACRCSVDTQPCTDKGFIHRVAHVGEGDGTHFSQFVR